MEENSKSQPIPAMHRSLGFPPSCGRPDTPSCFDHLPGPEIAKPARSARLPISLAQQPRLTRRHSSCLPRASLRTLSAIPNRNSPVLEFLLTPRRSTVSQFLIATKTRFSCSRVFFTGHFSRQRASKSLLPDFESAALSPENSSNCATLWRCSRSLSRQLCADMIGVC